MMFAMRVLCILCGLVYGETCNEGVCLVQTRANVNKSNDAHADSIYLSKVAHMGERYQVKIKDEKKVIFCCQKL